MRHERQALTALAFSGVIGPRRYASLAEVFGTADKIIQANRSELCELLGEKIGSKLHNAIDSFDMLKAEAMLQSKGITALTLADLEYPERLRDIVDPPLVLFCKGKIADKAVPSVAVVGARKATGYGLLNARKISREISLAGVHVVSGMAFGIDSEAHRGALEAGASTTAVLGCGVDVCYPSSNQKLYCNIIEHGSLISEFVPGTKPYAGNFPARNRIISAMADAVFVVEAAAGSGTLITVDFALEQGKDVFALPGNIGQTTSEGTNRLIQQGAKLITRADDILEELNLYFPGSLTATDNKDEIIEMIGQRILAFDDLLEESGLSVETLQSKLIILELEGKISRHGNVIFLSSNR